MMLKNDMNMSMPLNLGILLLKFKTLFQSCRQKSCHKHTALCQKDYTSGRAHKLRIWHLSDSCICTPNLPLLYKLWTHYQHDHQHKTNNYITICLWRSINSLIQKYKQFLRLSNCVSYHSNMAAMLIFHLQFQAS